MFWLVFMEFSCIFAAPIGKNLPSTPTGPSKIPFPPIPHDTKHHDFDWTPIWTILGFLVGTFLWFFGIIGLYFCSKRFFEKKQKTKCSVTVVQFKIDHECPNQKCENKQAEEPIHTYELPRPICSTKFPPKTFIRHQPTLERIDSCDSYQSEQNISTVQDYVAPAEFPRPTCPRPSISSVYDATYCSNGVATVHASQTETHTIINLIQSNRGTNLNEIVGIQPNRKHSV